MKTSCTCVFGRRSAFFCCGGGSSSLLYVVPFCDFLAAAKVRIQHRVHTVSNKKSTGSENYSPHYIIVASGGCVCKSPPSSVAFHASMAPSSAAIHASTVPSTAIILASMAPSYMSRVGHNRIYTYIYTVYLVISKPKIPYVHHIYMFWPTLCMCAVLVCLTLLCLFAILLNCA